MSTRYPTIDPQCYPSSDGIRSERVSKTLPFHPPTPKEVSPSLAYKDPDHPIPGDSDAEGSVTHITPLSPSTTTPLHRDRVAVKADGQEWEQHASVYGALVFLSLVNTFSLRKAALTLHDGMTKTPLPATLHFMIEEGSTDSIYEPSYHNQGIHEVLPRSGYSPALLRRTPDWGGSDPCISSKERETLSSIASATAARAPPEPWDYVYHGALVSRTAQWDPSEGVAGGLKSQQPTKGSSPSPAPPSMRDEEDAAESPIEEQEKGDKVSGGYLLTGGQQRRSSNSSQSLDSLNSGQSSSSGVTSGSICSSNRNSLRMEEDLLHAPRFCARARVHTDFVPSPYDMESLRLKVGDVIDVIARPTMGIWRGMLNGNIGSFKFVYVDVLEDRESEKYQSHNLCSKSRPETLEELLKQHSLGECCSILRLHGYQAVEDLARLRERHLAELNEIGPDNRRRLLATVESLQEPQCAREWHQGSETPTESSMVDLRTRPRDSGCHMPSDCSDNGKDDSEIHFQNISPSTLDQISAV
ncbi:unnamed protein product [Lota lota]